MCYESGGNGSFENERNRTASSSFPNACNCDTHADNTNQRPSLSTGKCCCRPTCKCNCDDFADSISRITAFSSVHDGTLAIGQQGQAYACANGKIIPNCHIIWHSSNPNVAYPDANGCIIAVGTGTAYICACLCGKKIVYDSFVVHVVSSESSAGGSSSYDQTETSPGLTDEEVMSRLQDLKQTYESGKFWCHDPMEDNDPHSVMDQPCAHDANHTHRLDGSCGCNAFGGGIQCYGFAMFMAYLVFGTYPNRAYAVDSSDPNDFGNGWRKYTDRLNELDIVPGDIIRADGHSAIVYEVKDGNLTVAECWGNPPRDSDSCKINWGNFNGTRANAKLAAVLSKADYVLKSPR